MSYDLSKALVGSISERPDAARPPEAGVTETPAAHPPVVHPPAVHPPVVHPPGVRFTEAGPHDPRPLDWGHAVDAAAARLEESWVRPDETGRMLSSGLAEELAATLCAFGMVAEEVVHMRDHADRACGGAEGTALNTPGKVPG